MAPNTPPGDPPPWHSIAQDPEFQSLVRRKARFVVPATIFFMLYYFALPVLVATQPELMRHEVVGKINVAYLFALSQFIMSWILAGIYVVVAAGWDRTATALLARLVGGKEKP